MIITIVTIVAVAATIFGYIAQMKKMNKYIRLDNYRIH